MTDDTPDTDHESDDENMIILAADYELLLMIARFAVCVIYDDREDDEVGRITQLAIDHGLMSQRRATAEDVAEGTDEGSLVYSTTDELDELADMLTEEDAEETDGEPVRELAN